MLTAIVNSAALDQARKGWAPIDKVRKENPSIAPIYPIRGNIHIVRESVCVAGVRRGESQSEAMARNVVEAACW